MADQNDKTKIIIDIFEVTIGGDRAPWEAKVSFGLLPDIHKVSAMRTGSNVLTSIVQGHPITGEIEFLQYGAYVLETLLGVGSSAPRVQPALGVQIPTFAVDLHPKGVAGDALDIHLLATVFDGMRIDSDGQGELRPVFPFHCQVDASENVYRVGPTP